MPRVKRGVIHTKRRKNILKSAEGYKWGRKNLIRQAKTAVTKAGVYAYRDRKAKKRVFRRLWQVRLNAAARMHDLRYSQLIHLMKQKNIELDRKVLSTIAAEKPDIFSTIISFIKE